MKKSERGYALVAAVASIAVFALIALMVIEASRGTIVAAGAEADRARVQAAAEAGLAIALRNLMNAGPGGASIDGRVQHVRFGEADLAIAIQDERGKIPLNALSAAQTRRLFEELGLSGDRLDVATDSFLDWLDDDDDPRPSGAEGGFYAPQGLHPRNGMLLSVAETALIRGVGKPLADRLEAIATVHFGNGSFEPAHASLTAIKVMEGEEKGAIDLIERQKELAGQRTAIALVDTGTLIGRPLSIEVEARIGQQARSRIRQIVILTGRASQPYILKDRS